MLCINGKTGGGGAELAFTPKIEIHTHLNTSPFCSLPCISEKKKFGQCPRLSKDQLKTSAKYGQTRSYTSAFTFGDLT